MLLCISVRPSVMPSLAGLAGRAYDGALLLLALTIWREVFRECRQMRVCVAARGGCTALVAGQERACCWGSRRPGRRTHSKLHTLIYSWLGHEQHGPRQWRSTAPLTNRRTVNLTVSPPCAGEHAHAQEADGCPGRAGENKAAGGEDKAAGGRAHAQEADDGCPG